MEEGRKRVLGGKVSDVTGIGMKQEINEKSVLFIALSDEGLINRQGNDNPANTQNDLFVGKADPAIFDVVLSHLTEDMLECTGQTLEPRTPFRGAACKIEVLFEFKDRTSGGFNISLRLRVGRTA